MEQNKIEKQNSPLDDVRRPDEFGTSAVRHADAGWNTFTLDVMDGVFDAQLYPCVDFCKRLHNASPIPWTFT
jgi:hypothetical protein